MKQKNVAVFFGGCSPEYSVSLTSAHAVLSHLDRYKYNILPIGISKDGSWYYYTGSPEHLLDDTWLRCEDCIPAMLSLDRGARKLYVFETTGISSLPVDVAFPVLHGKNGEDGTIQGAIALSGIALAGCGVLASALCMDKDRSHKLVSLAGVRVPQGLVLESGYTLQQAVAFAEKVGYPMYVKPVKAGSSFGITRVESPGQLSKAIDGAFLYDNQVILEENIQGIEVGCAVLGTETLLTGAIDEIELSKGFFNFTEKYTLHSSAIHVPARISDAKAEEIKQTAKRIYRALGCAGFARVDLFLTPSGQLVFNEVNTIPGFTEHSRYPGMMKAAGYSLADVLDRIIEQAVAQ